MGNDRSVPKKKRRSPIPRPQARPRPAAGIEIRHTPGMADALMRELAPLLAEEGIDLESGDVDLATMQAALDRAVERRNLALFTPVGRARDLAAAVLRRAVATIIDATVRAAVPILEEAVPESPDGSVAEVSSCIGLALGLVDRFLASDDALAPAGLAQRLEPRSIRGPGDRATPDILAAAPHAFDSLSVLIRAHGGRELHYGAAIALAIVIRSWASETDTPAAELIRTHIQ
jgi:hypothetical protein